MVRRSGSTIDTVLEAPYSRPWKIADLSQTSSMKGNDHAYFRSVTSG